MRELYTKEWFPYCNVMGISWCQFWDMNPRIVNAHKQGFKLKKEEQNAFAYIQGVYVRDALASTVGNMMKKKGAKAIEYPSQPYDLYKEDVSSDTGENGMTEAEKRKKTEEIFGVLSVMKANFDISKSANRESE